MCSGDDPLLDRLSLGCCCTAGSGAIILGRVDVALVVGVACALGVGVGFKGGLPTGLGVRELVLPLDTLQGVNVSIATE